MIIGYLDPGTGTLIVQAVLGGVAGVAVLVKTKGRRFFKRGGTESTPTSGTEAGAIAEEDHEEPIATGSAD